MTTNNTTISPELEKQIEKEAEGHADLWSVKMYGDIAKSAYKTGATAYAPYKEKCKLLVQLYEMCFKGSLERTRAFTKEEIEIHWEGVKAKYNL